MKHCCAILKFVKILAAALSWMWNISHCAAFFFDDTSLNLIQDLLVQKYYNEL